MSTRIKYGQYIFEGSVISTVATVLDDSEIMMELPEDTAEAVVQRVGVSGRLCDVNGVKLCDVDGIELYAPSSRAIDLSTYNYAEPVLFYHGGELQSKMFLNYTKRSGANTYSLYCTSAVGLLSNKAFYGGIYTAKPAGELIEEILSEFPNITYSIDADVSETLINGVLLKQSCREALQQVLFAIGASITKDDAGDIRFYYNSGDIALTIDADDEADGGTVDTVTPISAVNVTEHDYFVSDKTEEESLFDNTAPSAAVADGQLIEFGSPMRLDTLHAVDTDGNETTALTIVPVSVNACRVSGVGILLGKPYAHTMLIKRKENPSSAAVNEIDITEPTLVTALNSENVLERVYEYNTAKTLINVGIAKRSTDFKTGKLVSIVDPYDRTRVTGFVESMTVNYSGFLKADATILTGWSPNHLGSTYNRYLILSEGFEKDTDITWTVPQTLQGKAVAIVLFSGAGGGQAGFDGENGGDAPYYSNSTPYTLIEGGVSGEGGLGGSAGELGRFIRFTATLSEPNYTIRIGAGGLGGESNGELGLEGGATVFNGTSTEDGAELLGEYVNILTGTAIARYGNTGITGGRGGIVGTLKRPGSVYSTQRGDDGTAGESVGQWHGGTAQYYYYHYSAPRPSDDEDTHAQWTGGGAAYGSDGGEGRSGNNTYTNIAYSGDGADALPPGNADITCAGTGGNGGGGGGGAAASYWVYDDHSYGANRGSFAGAGGKGSAGGQGGHGAILIYYKE